VKIEIKLRDIVLDPANRVDLRSLPEDKALDMIRSAFGFLAAGTVFAIKGGVLGITIREQDAAEQAKAEKLVQSALELAKSGKHAAAIPLFLQALSSSESPCQLFSSRCLQVCLRCVSWWLQGRSEIGGGQGKASCKACCRFALRFLLSIPACLCTFVQL